MKETHKFTGCFIPAKIWLHDKLTPAQKMMLAEIRALSEETGWCFAGNGHFANWLKCEKQNISNYIAEFKKCGYVDVVYSDAKTHSGRKMRVNTEWYFSIDGQQDTTLEKGVTDNVPPYTDNVPPYIPNVGGYTDNVPPYIPSVPPYIGDVPEIHFKYTIKKEGESENKNLASLDTPTPAPVVEKSETVEAKKEKAPPVPAAPPEAPPGPGQSETGDRLPEIALLHRPTARTAAELREAMAKFYKDYPKEWTDGILQLAKGSRYSREKQSEIVTDWCCYQVEHNQQGNTYQMLNASLQKWFRNQERAESWKGSNSGSTPGNSDHTRYTPPPQTGTYQPPYVP